MASTHNSEYNVIGFHMSYMRELQKYADFYQDFDLEGLIEYLLQFLFPSYTKFAKQNGLDLKRAEETDVSHFDEFAEKLNSIATRYKKRKLDKIGKKKLENYLKELFDAVSKSSKR